MSLFARVLAGRDRAIDERGLDPVPVFRQGFGEGIDETGGFQDEAMQFSEDRGAHGTGRIALLVANLGYPDEARLRQPRQLPVNGPGAGAGDPNDVARAEIPSLLPEQQRQHALPDGERRARQRVRNAETFVPYPYWE